MEHGPLNVFFLIEWNIRGFSWLCLAVLVCPKMGDTKFCSRKDKIWLDFRADMTPWHFDVSLISGVWWSPKNIQQTTSQRNIPVLDGLKQPPPKKNRNRPESLHLQKCGEVRHGKDRCVCARMLATDRCFWEGRESWDLKIWRPNLTVGWAKQPFWLLDMSLIHPAETTKKYI